MSKRLDRINSLLRELAADFLMRVVSGVLLTITRIETAEDLKTAKIFISIFPENEEKETLRTLKEKMPELQKFIGSRIKIKFVPRLEIAIDNQIKAERKIDELLNGPAAKPDKAV